MLAALGTSDGGVAQTASASMMAKAAARAPSVRNR